MRPLSARGRGCRAPPGVCIMTRLPVRSLGSLGRLALLGARARSGSVDEELTDRARLRCLCANRRFPCDAVLEELDAPPIPM